MSRSWTNVYVNFSLPREDREALDRLLRHEGSSLGQEFRRTLQECLIRADVDPSALDGNTTSAAPVGSGASLAGHR